MFRDSIIRRGAWMQRAILAGAIAIYLLGYVAIRTEHLLVHSKSFVGSMDPEGAAVSAHGIKAGDFGAPMLGPATTLATLMAGLIYWPVTKVEIVYWNIVEPSGSPYDGEVPPPPDYDAIFGKQAPDEAPPK